jgi:hypothetical protein
MTMDGAPADPHGRGDLSIGEFRVIPQHERLALPPGKLPQRVDHRGPLQQPDRRLLRARHVRWRVRRDPGRDHPMPQNGTGPVDHTPAQIHQALVTVPEPAPVGVHRDERVLNDLLRRPAVMNQQRRKPHQRPVVGGVQGGRNPGRFQVSHGRARRAPARTGSAPRQPARFSRRHPRRPQPATGGMPSANDRTAPTRASPAPQPIRRTSLADILHRNLVGSRIPSMVTGRVHGPPWTGT